LRQQNGECDNDTMNHYLNVPQSLQRLNFDNRFVRELPADRDSSNQTRQVYRACYSRVLPTTVAAPRLVAYALEVANRLDL